MPLLGGRSEGEDGKVDILRIPGHVALTGGGRVLHKGLLGGGPQDDGAGLATVQLVELTLHLDKGDEVVLHTVVPTRGGGLALASRIVVAPTDAVILLVNNALQITFTRLIIHYFDEFFF